MGGGSRSRRIELDWPPSHASTPPVFPKPHPWSRAGGPGPAGVGARCGRVVGTPPAFSAMHTPIACDGIHAHAPGPHQAAEHARPVSQDLVDGELRRAGPRAAARGPGDRRDPRSWRGRRRGPVCPRGVAGASAGGGQRRAGCRPAKPRCRGRGGGGPAEEHRAAAGSSVRSAAGEEMKCREVNRFIIHRLTNRIASNSLRACTPTAYTARLSMRMLRHHAPAVVSGLPSTDKLYDMN